MARIVLVEGAADTLVERLRDVRSRGDIPLVHDDRWPDAQRESLQALTRASRPPVQTSWATLTSGSSDEPRLVLRSAASWGASYPVISEMLGTDDGGVVLSAPPSSSLTLFSLAHFVEGSGPRPVFPALDPGAARAATAFHGTPHGLGALLDTGSIPHVRTALVGGSHLDPRLRARAESHGIRVIAYYGAAELSFVAVDHGDGLRAFPGVELDVRHGELWVRSPYLALGYAGAGGSLRRDGDWATVGDLAQVTDGVLRLRGRADGAILTASATVIPEEVEAALRLVPGVRDAVVFALPVARVGSLVAAMIEAETADVRLSASVLRRDAGLRLAPAHRPRVWFAGELPRGASGKPARAEVLRRALAGQVPRVTA
ncbi:AMP-dependent synthetase and ligase [Xylanimonas cellulosilytica DSM 15894]|uniref:long-chain-fatty-acid--CoA ligase n=1 Tax=Xylanimonas cellulosilytica (strain DSM 15894 / JCM 12276 / CECT 5975 / KCTC 9989 / LMG 20990 / NBRC 107835 / XIL07) TaxID=446471 RepID=D1BZU6_XYLCX|nr:class I adenylate-forming enzyme family protein [Xylanimonas cellulosilytica]ACZ32074.1 AMP-dependent synthetase and ligase [Xylanimonas cellulosilytica DSM 15894]